LFEDLLPRLLVPLEGKIDLAALFPDQPSDIVLEIGFGGGERLAEQAAAEPHRGFIGCEPFVNGVGSLLSHIEKRSLSNVRIHPNDAREVMDALPDASLGICFVLYADPWPKTRHAERRFIGRENLDRLARLLKQGGELRLATDVPSLAKWMRTQAEAHPAFERIYDSFAPPEGWIATRYEQKGIAAGRKPVYMIYRRIK
jgi:tRNA (guanine-N7-)-methyltransferase